MAKPRTENGTVEYAKHLRKYGKRQDAKKVRQDAKKQCHACYGTKYELMGQPCITCEGTGYL